MSLISLTEKQKKIAAMNVSIDAIINEDERLIREGIVKRAPQFPDVFANDLIQKTIADNGLLYMYLEFVNVCNLGCKGCWNGYETEMKDFDPNERHRQSGNRKNILSFEMNKRLIDEGKNLGVRYINFIGGGEPTISPHFFSLIEYALAKDIRFETFTNGTLITPSVAERMFSLHVSPFVKLYSLDAKKHDYMVSRNGAHEAVLQAIDHLTAAGYGRVNDPVMAIETVISHTNLNEIPTLWRFARDRGLIPFFERFVGTDYNGDPSVLPSPSRLKELYEEIREIDRNEYGYTFPLVPLRIGFGCSPVAYGVYVQMDGAVKVCAGSPTVLGNIEDASLQSIVKNSKALQALRHIDQDPESYCGNCSYRKIDECYGCPGQAEIVGDKLTGDDPLCFHIPDNLSKPHGGVEH